MNLVEKFGEQVKTLIASSTTDVDAKAIIRRKPFIITENEKSERIIHLEVDGDLNTLKSGNFNATIRMDSHVVAIIRLKEAVNGKTIPFAGDVVAATHADIAALVSNQRVKIEKITKEEIILDKEVSIPARATVRLMDLQRATKFANAKCRCCGEVKKVPLFHGVAGYCRECNEKIIKPMKSEFGAYLQHLLEEGMYFEEAHNARTFRKNEIDSISRVDGKLIINVGNEEIRAFCDYRRGEYLEILDRKPFDRKAEYDGQNYIINGKQYRIKIHEWARGLSTKIKELRVDKNMFMNPMPFNGTFITKDCYGDQTLLHMRRMYNIARAKYIMGKRIKNVDDALECVEKAEMIMTQPDCSRKLHMIITKQLEYAAQVLDVASNMEGEMAQKIIGILTAIQVGLSNTSVAHEEEGDR